MPRSTASSRLDSEGERRGLRFSSRDVLDELLPPPLREVLEERFWRPIERTAVLESLVDDPAFLADPVNHPALFSDHGVIHVRDVAAGVVSLADAANGVLLPGRPPERQSFVAAYAVLIAYLHDIGMDDQTRAGRRLHAVRAAHVAFGRDLDGVVEGLLAASGPVALRLADVDAQSPFPCGIDVVLRELLALSFAHSKSLVPAPMLEDPTQLRRLAQRIVLTDLETHRACGVLPSPDEAAELSANTDRYDDAVQQSFEWLVSEEPAHSSLTDDVVDALRILRAADALRQRGTSLKTTAGYEIFIDAASGEAVFSLRAADNKKVYLLRGDSPKSAGEANLRLATIAPDGHLRIAFHRGGFLEPAATRYAAESTAHVVGDILEDVLGSLARSSSPEDLEAPAVSIDDVQVRLERPADNPPFAEEVGRLVAAQNPWIADRVRVVADLEGAPSNERERYQRGVPVGPIPDEAGNILDQLARHGAKVEGIDVEAAFADVRRVRFHAGEVVAPIGSLPAFVYVAEGPGMRVQPGGGYPAAAVSAWVPVGTTGVIRRSERNAEVTVDQDVDVLMIPAETYIRVWFRPYTADELAATLGTSSER